MNLGLRTILLLVSMVLFVLGAFSDTNFPEFIGLGLAVLAAAFISEALGWADRTVGTSTTRRDDNP